LRETQRGGGFSRGGEKGEGGEGFLEGGKKTM